MFFDNQYSKMFESGDQYLGIADKIDPNFDWTNNTSGWKKIRRKIWTCWFDSV